MQKKFRTLLVNEEIGFNLRSILSLFKIKILHFESRIAKSFIEFK